MASKVNAAFDHLSTGESDTVRARERATRRRRADRLFFVFADDKRLIYQREHWGRGGLSR